MNSYQESFEGKVRQFLVNNVEAFNALTREAPRDKALHLHDSELYGDPLPLEYLMEVSAKERQRRLMKLIILGDIVRGHVILKTTVALGVLVTSLVGSSKVREISDLGVRGLAPLESLTSDKGKCEGILDDMQVDDVVQAVVIGKNETHLSISFKPEDVSIFCSTPLPPGVALGYLERERPSLTEKRSVDPYAFLAQLREDPGFANPSSTDNLKSALGIVGYSSQTKPTLVTSVQKAVYPESDYSYALRKVQRLKWSMETVAVGVKHFKEGDLEKALKLFYHALDIDPCNVEGLVARGALFANKNKYMKAIADFEAALTQNCSHRNARRYLVETRMAYGQELEEEGCLEEAAICYREALADDPDKTAAKTKLDIVSKQLQRKAAEKLGEKRKEAAEMARIKNLHSLIREEKKRKEKRKTSKVARKTKKKRRNRKRTARAKKSSRQRHYSTDSDSSSYSTSFSSDFHSSSHNSSLSPGSTSHLKAMTKIKNAEGQSWGQSSSSLHTSSCCKSTRDKRSFVRRGSGCSRSDSCSTSSSSHRGARHDSHSPQDKRSVKRGDKRGRRKRTPSCSPSPFARTESRGGSNRTISLSPSPPPARKERSGGRKRTVSHSPSPPPARKERSGGRKRTVSHSPSPTPARKERRGGRRRTISRSRSPSALPRKRKDERREMRKKEVRYYEREEKRQRYSVSSSPFSSRSGSRQHGWSKCRDSSDSCTNSSPTDYNTKTYKLELHS